MRSIKHLIKNYKTDIKNILNFCNNDLNISYFLTKVLKNNLRLFL